MSHNEERENASGTQVVKSMACQASGRVSSVGFRFAGDAESLIRPMISADIQDRVYENAGNAPLLDLVPASGGRALDCGCGAGDNARLLNERGWRVTGITLSRGEEASASAQCERVVVADLEEGLSADIGNGYELVLMSHVLEHLANPQRLLADARRALAANGVLAVALPNVLVYPNRLRLLLGRFDYSSGGVMDNTHLRFYTFASGAALLRENGWDVVEAHADGTFPLWKLRRLIPRDWVRRLERWAGHWRPGLFGIQSLYIARPRIERLEGMR